ncbi:hypothetical protein KSP39_PZI009861 [Platanthera zijinensis]|uniref:BED-type domain-containing protein n=1 Tax=Platanthera zijinensis TaxID=2320716 RepID=A0AAP0BKQ4_9ASPA
MEGVESTNSSAQVREKNDPGWEHFSLVKDASGKKKYRCLHCGTIYSGGGINRMKQHLAGIKGNIGACKKVPHDIRHQMQENLKGITEKKQEIQESRENIGSQPSIKSVLASKQVVHRADMAVARWFYDSCIPMNALNSIYAQKAIDAIAAIGPGYKLPTYYMMRVNLLRDCKEECQLLVEAHRNSWKESGCTIMADGWTDIRSRTLINFLVYCPRGLSFLKSVDASDITKDANTLCALFSEVVEWVGVTNIVQIVTDNAANYKKAGALLHEKYANIYWSPCAAHCLNLILKEICSMTHVKDIANKASKVTILVYNHIFLLSWLRKREGWKEIVRPGATRFATTFITLKSVHDHKHDLQALITSKYYSDSKLAKTVKGKEATSIILDNKFWSSCLIMTKISGPIIRLLRIVDADEKPSLGYVYDGLYRVRKAIKNLFKDNKRLYKPYTIIIKSRWDSQFRQGIHSAAYFLNPTFQYDRDNYCQKPEVMQGLVELIGNKEVCSKPKEAMMEVRLFRDQLESFGKPLAIKLATEMQPDEWWRMFGSSAPQLQKLAIRILSQTSSSSGCERNWSVFEKIHTKRRNRLEHQRLNDLVYVRYNLNMRNRYDFHLISFYVGFIFCIFLIIFYTYRFYHSMLVLGLLVRKGVTIL